jgi:hypothetical protein
VTLGVVVITVAMIAGGLTLILVIFRHQTPLFNGMYYKQVDLAGGLRLDRRVKRVAFHLIAGVTKMLLQEKSD